MKMTISEMLTAGKLLRGAKRLHLLVWFENGSQNHAVNMLLGTIHLVGTQNFLKN